MTRPHQHDGAAVHHLLVEAAREAAAAVAVVDITETGSPVERTYRDLLDRTERFASALAECGVSRGDRVVMDAVNSAAAIAMLMACSMRGAAFVPLTHEVPDERARQIVALSRPHTYVHLPVTGRLSRLTSRTGIGAVEFSWDGCKIIASHAEPSREAFQLTESQPERELAYLIFTSGSTGSPKGAAMSQQAISAFFRATRGVLRPTDRVASTAPLHFDFCLLDIGTCLANRCAIVTVPRDSVRWPRRLVAALSAGECTRVHAVPSVWRPLLRRQPQLLADLPPLDAVMFSGEVFPPKELAILHRALPDTRLVNCYGPTECMACSFTDVTPHVGDPQAEWLIDNAYPGSSLALVTDDGARISEPGHQGQIRFTGPSVFDGYWSADGTALQPPTVRRPASGSPSLLTGDYGHLGEDGRIRFDGRKDRQVKVAGNRVELREIEATLLQVDGIDEVRVVADSSAGLVSLVAFLSGPDDDQHAREQACRQACAAELPSYMHPERLVHLPRLPMTANGKVDQQRLVREARLRQSHRTEEAC